MCSGVNVALLNNIRFKWISFPGSFQSSVSQASVLPTPSVPIPQSGYFPFNAQSTIVNIVPSTTNIPIPHGGYIPFKSQGTNVNIALSTNSALIPRGSYISMSSHSTNLNIVPFANITHLPHGGFILFSGQGTNSSLVASTMSTSKPQWGYISFSCQGDDLKVLSQTLYPPVQSKQNTNTSNQFLPCTPNQVVWYSTKQPVLIHNHIQHDQVSNNCSHNKYYNRLHKRYMLLHCKLKIRGHNRLTVKHCRPKSTCNSRNNTVFRRDLIRLSIHHSISQCSKTCNMYTMLAKYINKFQCDMYYVKYLVWHQTRMKTRPLVLWREYSRHRCLLHVQLWDGPISTWFKTVYCWSIWLGFFFILRQ